jgi:hypothetical protein
MAPIKKTSRRDEERIKQKIADYSAADDRANEKSPILF